ncbi:unnamed protein product [Trichogramma brassicae]|uniref:Uncharacterized protein n=1 Tax=Trichogramma brassicae TaxID=86971 RepID=A0A6H5J340_9HYME|nr:unnamed protein product [Trichogramma brassicae]
MSLYHVYRRALTLTRGQCVWTCTTIGVLLSALRKKWEDCQLRQVMRMNSYDDRVRLSALRKRCEDCERCQVMRMNLYEYRSRATLPLHRLNTAGPSATTATNVLNSELPHGLGSRSSARPRGTTDPARRRAKDRVGHMNIDISNAHCGPRISFPDHAWLRVVYKNEPDCSLARESVDLGARLYLSYSSSKCRSSVIRRLKRTARKKMNSFVLTVSRLPLGEYSLAQVLPIVLRRVPELSRLVEQRTDV